MEKVILNEEIYSGNHKVSNYLVIGHYGVTTDQFHFLEFFIFCHLWAHFSNLGLLFILGRFCIFGWFWENQ